MEKQQQGTPWESVYVPKEAVTREFVHEKTGKNLCEIVLPDALPEGAPKCGGWHFYMPATCVRDVKSGDKRLSFPPSWTGVRFYSPFVKGKRPDVMEFPMNDALAMLRDTFGNH